MELPYVSLRPIGVLVLLVGAFSGPILGRAWREQRRELSRTDELLRQGDLALAAEHARTAATWSLPLRSAAPAACLRLRHIAQVSEASGDRPTSVYARTLLSSVTCPSAAIADEPPSAPLP